MLKDFNFQVSISKEEYKQNIQPLRQELAVLQQTIKDKKLPVIILFEGFSAAGKGNRIADTIKTLDPRYFKVYSIVDSNEIERRMPPLWKYWNKIPSQGEITILDQSWYHEIAHQQLQSNLNNTAVYHSLKSIETFERQLSDNGILIIKLFLNITKKEQTLRLEKLYKKKTTRWRVTEQDRKANEEFFDYLELADQMLTATNFSFAPWHVIDGMHQKNANLQIYQTVIHAIHTKLQTQDPRQSNKETSTKKETPIIGNPCKITMPKEFQIVAKPKLSEIDLNKKADPNSYKKTLTGLQKKLNKLHNEIYRKRIPVIIVFEGWDAAGKGGNIKRIASALDPRGYSVHPIAAPTVSELEHHYLWRFWMNLPKNGHIAIFDRSWYGRVMVERIEGFCTTQEWQRAYQEINEFERELFDWGALILKYWLQIDQKEQLRRFTQRQNTPAKRWKITDEDWRNRGKWKQYEDAVNQMIALTSTNFAPWNIIEANDKPYARIKTLEILIDAIEKRLK